MCTRLTTALVALAAVLVAPPSHAIEMTGIGARIGYAAPEAFDAALLFGAQVEFSRPGGTIRFVPKLVYWEAKGVSDLNPSFDISISFDAARSVSPYMGLGLSIHFLNVRTTETFARDTGGNLLAGVAFERTARRYFLESRYTIADMSQLSVLGGVTVALP